MGDSRITLPSPISGLPSPDYLVIGHVTVDRLATGIAPGGTVTYATTAVARLGLRAGVLTSAGEEMDWSRHLPNAEIVRRPSPASTSSKSLPRWPPNPAAALPGQSRYR